VFGDVAFAQAPFASQGGKTVLAALADSATTSDALSAESNFGGLISETAFVDDSTFSANNLLTAFIAELAAASEAQSVIASMLASASESAAASDASTAFSSVSAAVFESVTASDASAANAMLLGFVAEAVAASDASDGTRVFAVAVSESATGTDAQTTTAVFIGTVAELASAQDALSVVKTKNVSVTGVQLFISIGGTLVWATIDDSQNPNWQNITNAQGSGWVVVNDAQNPGWTNLPS
jgi:hypothetical protein